MKTKAYILICQVFKIEFTVTTEMISPNYPNFGNFLNFMDRDKLNFPEQFGKKISIQKSLINCSTI